MNIIKVYLKNNKKSISSVEPVDLFIALCVLVLMISPVISNFILRLNTGIKRTEMFLSVRCEELFGKDTTQTLLREFEERNPDLQIKTAGEKSREPDILIFDENDYNDLVARGALASLETYIHTENRTVQFAVPLVSFMDLLFYNIELLKNAGFARPPKTRDEFFACAKA
ncbi:MAG: extracellular solute-binding protein, partial [Treponema sp.]|nr:extracellular solute-binding protein [Treponema sp.]